MVVEGAWSDVGPREEGEGDGGEGETCVKGMRGEMVGDGG